MIQIHRISKIVKTSLFTFSNRNICYINVAMIMVNWKSARLERHQHVWAPQIYICEIRCAAKQKPRDKHPYTRLETARPCIQPAYRFVHGPRQRQVVHNCGSHKILNLNGIRQSMAPFGEIPELLETYPRSRSRDSLDAVILEIIQHLRKRICFRNLNITPRLQPGRLISLETSNGIKIQLIISRFALLLVIV